MGPWRCLLATGLAVVAALCPPQADADAHWYVLSDRDGMVVERRLHDGSPFYEVRATAHSQLPPAAIFETIWRQREHPQFRYVPVLSEPAPEDAWAGRTGFVHVAVMEDLHDLSGHQVYACGGPAMIDAARADFTRRCGLPENEFFADSFTFGAEGEARLGLG